jgi:glycosyltransferase involved in cell wall biosynthesis
LRQFYIEKVLVRLLSRLALVTAVSRATAQDVVRFGHVPSERVRVIHCGVSMGEREIGPGSQGDRPYLLYPARLEHPGKNHLRLLAAFAASSVRRTHDLVLCGADWGAESLVREQALALDLKDRVKILGFVERRRFESLLDGANIVVAAGLREGFGLQAAEALACGKVIAASNTGSLPEVVGPLGVLFDPLDVGSMAGALDRAASDAGLRERCALEGPRRAAAFSWDAAAKATGEALCEVLDAAA